MVFRTRRAFEIMRGIDARSSLAAGADGLRLLAFPVTNELAAGGGVEQRGTIVSHDVLGQVVRMEDPFDPAPTSGIRWRVPRALCARNSGAIDSTETRSFVWDSRDLGFGSVFLRAVAVDSELGPE